MKFADQFKQKYRTFINSYASCMKNAVRGLSYANCYSAFVSPWGQSLCMKKLGPMLAKQSETRQHFLNKQKI